MEQVQKRVIAILSAPADAPLRIKFEQQIRPLIQNRNLTIWNTEKIFGGQNWQQAGQDALQQAYLILLMISGAFFSDARTYQMMEFALDLAISNPGLVIPILLSPVLYEEYSGLADRQCLPRNERPVTMWSTLDEALREIARELRELINTRDSFQNTLRLNAETQHLVVAREEERRRLRCDLHDVLGPTLGSMLLQVSSARLLLLESPGVVEILLKNLETDVKGSISDLRRLVYALRPFELDALGLIDALHEYIRQHNIVSGSHVNASGQRGLSISMEVPPSFPPLAAAVEVAAYHIVREAVNNVVQHAHAHNCLVRFAIISTTLLQIEIVDDGQGFPKKYKKGVGLNSLQERARELGGSCLVGPALPSGTRVLCKLPLLTETSSKSENSLFS